MRLTKEPINIVHESKCCEPSPVYEITVTYKLGVAEKDKKDKKGVLSLIKKCYKNFIEFRSFFDK